MAETKIYRKCWRCNSTGKLIVPGVPPGSPPIMEDPCTACNGTGQEQAIDQLRLDPELEEKVDVLTTNMVTVLAELDYIHGKVTAIWNAVKPGV